MIPEVCVLEFLDLRQYNALVRVSKATRRQVFRYILSNADAAIELQLSILELENDSDLSRSRVVNIGCVVCPEQSRRLLRLCRSSTRLQFIGPKQYIVPAVESSFDFSEHLDFLTRRCTLPESFRLVLSDGLLLSSRPIELSKLRSGVPIPSSYLVVQVDFPEASVTKEQLKIFETNVTSIVPGLLNRDYDKLSSRHATLCFSTSALETSEACSHDDKLELSETCQSSMWHLLRSDLIDSIRIECYASLQYLRRFKYVETPLGKPTSISYEAYCLTSLDAECVVESMSTFSVTDLSISAQYVELFSLLQVCHAFIESSERCKGLTPTLSLTIGQIDLDYDPLEFERLWTMFYTERVHQLLARSLQEESVGCFELFVDDDAHRYASANGLQTDGLRKAWAQLQTFAFYYCAKYNVQTSEDY